ncbi:Protein notum [Fasciola hepatica]|uniref:Protein notum n=1 Tax=Fasciola hepatica TaxID=6192 RepID=A0A4E0RLB0_FASHE|nr:Protein notum [Fasciola hepatica]
MDQSMTMIHSVSGAKYNEKQCRNFLPTYPKGTLLNSNPIRQHFIASLLILITWTALVHSRPNGHGSVFRHPVSASKSGSLSDSTGLTDWQPLMRPNNGWSSQFNQRSWSWRTSQRLSGNFILHHFHKLHLLNDSTALCNDGSPSGYYYRPSKNPDARNWLIFLEGGWYCFDEDTCRLRESSTFTLFSSATWPANRVFDGILSAYENINPIYHDYHNVFIPYCSSDLWTGKQAGQSGDFYFHGSRILQAVVDQLRWPETVERVVFAGSSAGGIGVLMNVDRLSRRLVQRLGYPVLVSGIIDSAWFIHTPAYRPAKCSNVFECPAEEGIHRGMRFWKARIPKRCRKQQSKGELWRCYLAPFMYEYLKTPVYIVQSLFDEAQMQMSKVPLLNGGTYEKWAYIQKLGKQVAQSLQNIKGVFAPSCIDHEILTKNNWVHKAIGKVGLVDALQAWDRQLVREWTRERMTLRSMRNPYPIANLRSAYRSTTSQSYPSDLWRPDNMKFTKNSTLLFLSRLVFMLNQRVRRRRHLTEIPLPKNNSAAGSPKVASLQDTPARRRSARSTIDTHYTSSPTSLTMTRQPNLLSINPSQHPYMWYLNRMPLASSIPSYFTANDYNIYHVIDSCGLISGQGDRGGYLCKSDRINETTRIGRRSLNTHSPSPPEFDHLIPQCNPTCGFLSNPQRMKLVDVLALYEVNTELLASILGLTTSELKNLDSEQQMQMLFCGNGQLTRQTRSSVSPRHSADFPARSWTPSVTTNQSVSTKSQHQIAR